ncbi:hypothetical protein ACW7BJ_32500 [Azospirillum argentinense]
MFVVDEAMAAAVRRAYDERGEWPAVAELRRHVYIDDNAEALRVVRTIASWRRSPEASERPPA